MDPVRAGAFSQVHDRLHVEKALHRAGADEVRLVGLLHEDGGGVALRVYRDGPDPELPAGADDAHGDLAAVGDEDSLKHSPSESATGYHRAREQVEGLAGMVRWLQREGRNVLELPGPVRLFGLDQHDGLRAAAASDHVDPRQPGLDRRHRRLNGRLVHVLERDLGAIGHGPEGDADETFLRAEIFPLDRDLVPRLRGVRLDFRDLGPRSHVTDRGFVHGVDRKSTRLNSSHGYISYAVFCLKKKKKEGYAGASPAAGG